MDDGAIVYRPSSIVNRTSNGFPRGCTRACGQIGHRLDQRKGAAANQHAEATEEPLCRWIESIVAPGQRGPQRLVARCCIDSAIGQQIQALLKTTEQHVRREQLDPRRRKLDSQR